MVQTGSALRLPFKRAFEHVWTNIMLCEWKGPYSYEFLPGHSNHSPSFPLPRLTKLTIKESSFQVTPRNEIERLFNVVVIMSAMVIFSTFISAITNAMNQLRNLNSHLSSKYFGRGAEQHMVKRPLLTFVPWGWLQRPQPKFPGWGGSGYHT